MNGKELRRRREAGGLSLDQLAELIGLASAGRRSAIYRLEQNDRIKPQMAMLLDMVLSKVEADPQSAPNRPARGRPKRVTA